MVRLRALESLLATAERRLYFLSFPPKLGTVLPYAPIDACRDLEHFGRVHCERAARLRYARRVAT